MAVPESEREAAFNAALDTAVVHVWAELPQAIQEKLFENAVVAGHRSEELVTYLHDHHARTQAAQTP